MQAAAVSLFALLAGVAHAEWGLNMTQGVTILSKKIYGLHMLIMWICVILAVVVFGVMIYSLINFRKSKGAEPDKTLLHSTKVEIVWTVIPIFILIGMAVPIAKTSEARPVRDPDVRPVSVASLHYLNTRMVSLNINAKVGRIRDSLSAGLVRVLDHFQSPPAVRRERSHA